MNRYAIGFRWAVILGVVANLSLAVPGVFVPNAVLGLVGLPPAMQQIWPSFASLLLILLSLMYLPAAYDPFAYRPVAWLAVGARAVGAIYFLGFHPEYLAFGLLDLVFGLIEGVLLLAAYARGPVDLELAEAHP
jgi:hypothetical protein